MDRETLQSYLSQARSEGKFDSAGTFTIDYAEAREKLAAYQFQRPQFYLLKFVQAAVAMKSEAVEFRFAPDSVEVRFVSPKCELPPEQFAALVTDNHEAHSERYYRDLALAVCGSQASTICFRDTGSGREVNIRGDSLDFTELGSLRGDSKFLFFLGRDRPLSKSEIKVKEAVIRVGCQFAPLQVSIDGKRINETRSNLSVYEKCLEGRHPVFWGEAVKDEEGRSGLGLPAEGRTAQIQLWDEEGRDVRDSGEIWVSLRDRMMTPKPYEKARMLLLAAGELEGPSTLYLVQYGVVISEQKIQTAVPGLIAVVCVDGHPTDLSGFQLRESDLMKAELTDVGVWAERLRAHMVFELKSSKPEYLKAPTQSGPSAVVGGVVVGGLLGLVVGPYGSVFGACSGAALGKAFLKMRGRAAREPHEYLKGVLGL
jgi:hypothetical protein